MTRGSNVGLARAAILLVGIAAVVLLVPGSAAAHAVLIDAQPPDGARLDRAPVEVRLIFNEDVEVPVAGLRVFDADAQRVDNGQLRRPSGDVVAVGLPPSLADGGYVVAYRVVSADGHPISGVLRFTVGDADAVDDDTLEARFGELSASSTLSSASRLLRGVLTALLVGSAGVVLAAGLLPLAGGASPALQRGVVLAGVAVVVLSVVAVPVQAVVLSGAGWSAATDAVALRDALRGAVGQAVGLRVVAVGLLAVLVARAGWSGRGRAARLAGGLAVAGLASLAIEGHQRSVSPVALLIAVDLVHVVAVALWVGALVVLAVHGRAHRRRNEVLPAVALLDRVSMLAAVVVGVVALSGIAAGVVLVGSPTGLVATGYGQLLIAKTVLVAGVLAVAGYNRFLLLPAVRRDAAASDPDPHLRAWRRLDVTVGVELTGLAVVLLVTGLLATQVPAVRAAQTGGIVQERVVLTDELTIEVGLDPGRAGVNTLHVYAFDVSGMLTTEVTDLRLELTYDPQGIGPIVIEPMYAGEGHWLAATDEVRFAGPWTLRIVAGLDRFTEVSVETTLEVDG